MPLERGALYAGNASSFFGDGATGEGGVSRRSPTPGVRKSDPLEGSLNNAGVTMPVAGGRPTVAIGSLTSCEFTQVREWLSSGSTALWTFCRMEPWYRMMRRPLHRDRSVSSAFVLSGSLLGLGSVVVHGVLDGPQSSGQ